MGPLGVAAACVLSLFVAIVGASSTPLPARVRALVTGAGANCVEKDGDSLHRAGASCIVHGMPCIVRARGGLQPKKRQQLAGQLGALTRVSPLAMLQACRNPSPPSASLALVS